MCCLAVWLFGRRFFVGAGKSAKYPLMLAVADLGAAPLFVALVGAAILAFLSGLDAARHASKALVLFVFFLSIAWCFARLLELSLLSKRNQDDTGYLPGIQRGLLFGLFLFAGVGLFMFVQGYSITGLYISTGAVAALVAFAMQQTLGDLFSGIALSIEHPFKLGEYIRLADGSEGKVVDVNWRATRLLAWDNTTLVVPNSELAKQGITNLHGADHPYAPWYEVKVPAEVDPRLAQALLLEAALKCSKIMKDPLPTVRLADASTVPYTYMVWVHFPNYVSMFAGREQLFQEIHYALKDVGTLVSPDIYEHHSRQIDPQPVEPPTTMLALRMVDISKFLSDEELDELAQRSTREVFDAGTVIATQGQIANTVDVVLHGVVKASVATPSGKPTVVDHLRSGQYFSLTSIVMDTPSFLSFTASTNVTLIRIEIDALQKVLAARPELRDEFAAILKNRMDAAQDAHRAGPIEDRRLTLKDVLKRVEHWLQ
ncbi:Mechanosensitive channel protein [Sulfitobacter donghicola DSW-25 = KCTC 12864 = JCM 14565]|uniref:Small-conductance mechanosensitive channel n=2 Tax=Sulfitobacter TaxID=60136 RepID=A0A073ISF4_9RHOB|nr:mechanosensitive ion channel protein [Sulfitobacter donghicola DSW-25 = KCTC 12864 = JCM 14565]KIN68924.1 Mechanosensitive channel protein [Sulfitobacter donghicola DSW-25 = KCTC 12864 = JCM 14565]